MFITVPNHLALHLTTATHSWFSTLDLVILNNCSPSMISISSISFSSYHLIVSVPEILQISSILMSSLHVISSMIHNYNNSLAYILIFPDCLSAPDLFVNSEFIQNCLSVQMNVAGERHENMHHAERSHFKSMTINLK